MKETKRKYAKIRKAADLLYEVMDALVYDEGGETIRLCFPTKEARKAADAYGVRGFLKDAIKEAQA